jgi:RHS repeat-associated protein
MYDVYGSSTFLDGQWTPTSTSPRGFGKLFSTYELASETTLYDVRRRIYHPALGRWLSRDPGYGWREHNHYLYVDSRPDSRIDPYGLFSVTFGIGGEVSLLILHFSANINILSFAYSECKGASAGLLGMTIGGGPGIGIGGSIGLDVDITSAQTVSETVGKGSKIGGYLQVLPIGGGYVEGVRGLEEKEIRWHDAYGGADISVGPSAGGGIYVDNTLTSEYLFSGVNSPP